MAIDREAIQKQIDAYLANNTIQYQRLQTRAALLQDSINNEGPTPANKAKHLFFQNAKVELMEEGLSVFRNIKQEASALHGEEAFYSQVLTMEAAIVRELNEGRNELKELIKQYIK